MPEAPLPPPDRAAHQGLDVAAVLAHIAGWIDLTQARRDQLASAVRRTCDIWQIAAPHDAGEICFTAAALNPVLWRRSYTALGFRSVRSYTNVISRLRTVLERLGELDSDFALTTEWQAVYDTIPTVERRRGLVRFFRYASGQERTVAAVRDDTLPAFDIWLQTRQLTDHITAKVTRTASGWNWAVANVPGWPQVVLHRAGMRTNASPPLSAYPLSFQLDAQAFLDGLKADPLTKLFSGKLYSGNSRSPRSRPRGASDATVKIRSDCIRAATDALRQSGIPMEQFRTLRDLVIPAERVEIIVSFHYRRRQERVAGAEFDTRPAHLEAIIETLRQIAKFYVRLPDTDLTVFAEIRRAIGGKTEIGLTEKNLARLRVLLQPENEARLLHLPAYLMQRAQKLWKAERARGGDSKAAPPAAAARLAMFATALEILTFCPFRRRSLVTLDIRRDLKSDNPKGRLASVRVIPGNSKTRVPLDWEVPEVAAELIGAYLADYRPVLAVPGNSALFPGIGARERDAAQFATDLKDLVEKEVGVKWNVHLARHFCAARYLRRYPDRIAVISLVLGHRNPDMTRVFYAGLEVNAASKQSDAVTLADRERTRPIAAAAFAARRGRPRSI